MPSHDGRRVALALLVVAYTLNFIDRQIVGILAGPIKAALDLSDTQLGLVGGLSFALFYTTLGIPVAVLADRTGRARVIAWALGVWSGFTALCGAATGFWTLFLARMGVGVGESGGTAPSYALIADLYPREERARALAIFAFGSPIGSALGIFLGGWVASQYSWRAAFVVVGVLGVLCVPVFRRFVREPGREGVGTAGATPAGASSSDATHVNLASLWRELRRVPEFWLCALGAAFTSVVGYGVLFWMPTFFERSHGLDLLTRAALWGSIILVGGTVGAWLGGWLGDRLGARGKRWYTLVPAMSIVAAVPLYAAGVSVASLPLAFVLILVPQALGLMWLGPITSTVQHLVPAAFRASASAVFLFILNLIGIGGGTLYFGAVSDALVAQGSGPDSLRLAILSGLPFYLVAALLFVLASRRLEAAWRD